MAAHQDDSWSLLFGLEPGRFTLTRPCEALPPSGSPSPTQLSLCPGALLALLALPWTARSVGAGVTAAASLSRGPPIGRPPLLSENPAMPIPKGSTGLIMLHVTLSEPSSPGD